MNHNARGGRIGFFHNHLSQKKPAVTTTTIQLVDILPPKSMTWSISESEEEFTVWTQTLTIRLAQKMVFLLGKNLIDHSGFIRRLKDPRE